MHQKKKKKRKLAMTDFLNQLCHFWTSIKNCHFLQCNHCLFEHDRMAGHPFPPAQPQSPLPYNIFLSWLLLLDVFVLGITSSFSNVALGRPGVHFIKVGRTEQIIEIVLSICTLRLHCTITPVKSFPKVGCNVLGRAPNFMKSTPDCCQRCFCISLECSFSGHLEPIIFQCNVNEYYWGQFSLLLLYQILEKLVT